MKAAKYVILVFFTIICVFPLVFAGISSLKSVEAYSASKLALPETITFDHYVAALTNLNMTTYLLNSVIMVALAMVIYFLVCTAAGYAFGLLRFRGRLTLFSLVLFLMIFPQMVIASQIYRIIVGLGLLNTRAGVILVWAAYFSPFGTYIMTTYYSSVPRALIESARIDGANVFTQLVYIMIPVAAPMIGTIGIVGSFAMWQELPFSLFILQRPELRTISLGIVLMQGEHGVPIPTLSAAFIISAVLPFVGYLFFQRRIAMGATAGSLKG